MMTFVQSAGVVFVTGMGSAEVVVTLPDDYTCGYAGSVRCIMIQTLLNHVWDHEKLVINGLT